MPSVSAAQQHLMGAAYAGAKFPMARAIQRSMTLAQMRDFAATKTAKLPGHVKKVPKVKPSTKSSY